MRWKRKIKKITNRLLTCDENALKKKLVPYTLVSFDVFDTLIKRSVAQPRDVFLYAAQRYNLQSGKNIDPEQFCEIRVAAEQEAHRRVHMQNREEVTLEEIYQCLPEVYQAYANQLLQAEIDMEKSCCHADPTMKKVYQWCRDQGKRIFITSDMYLPRHTVEEILDQSGYSGYILLVSSEFGVTKRSGRLFEILLKQNGLEKKSLIHLGDNLRGDVLGAQKQGIASVWISNDPNRCRFTQLNTGDPQTKKQMQIIRTIMNGYIDPTWDPYYQFGFEVLGPLLYGFCTWLHERVKQEGLNSVFFLSRDGYLMQKGYRLLYGEEAVCNRYLYVSRRALFIPQLWIHPEFEHVIWSLGENTVWNCEKLCDKLGMDRETGLKRWTECGLLPEQSFLSRNMKREPKVLRFYQSIQEEVVQKSKEAYAVFLQYLQQEAFSGSVTLVDIGWQGSMQYYLQNILAQANIPAEIHGYYVGRVRNVIPDLCLHAYIPAGENPQLGASGLFESLFLSREGSTKTYRKDPDGKIIPELYDSEYTQTKEAAMVEAFQNGALAFIDAMKTGIGAQPVPYTVATANILRVLRNPGKRELQMFADFGFADGEVHPLAVPKSFWTYIQKPGSLLTDFANSQWKNGFLKKLFRFPLPYWRVLFALKRLKGK